MHNNAFRFNGVYFLELNRFHFFFLHNRDPIIKSIIIRNFEYAQSCRVCLKLLN